VVTLQDWTGLVAGRRTDEFDRLRVVAPIDESRRSWGGPFRALASDDKQYFIKCLDACPPGEGASLAIELVVTRMGELISAPVCTTSLIRIPDELAGWQYRPGKPLQAGLAHASRALDRADEGREQLNYRANDDNRRRHVGVYALFDWCFGWDQQWLYDLTYDRTVYSHDHGLYLPPGGKGYWKRAGLEAMVGRPHVLPDSQEGLDPEAVVEVASALEKIDRDSLIEVLRTVPSSWPVRDTDLEDLGWFLEARAPEVAARVRMLTGRG
jgi:hypothetical protein